MDATLDGHVRHWASWRPEGIAVRFEGQSITWAELDRMADELAAGLAERGIGHGDVVALLMGNRPEFLEVAMATLRLGAILAPLNVRHTATEIAHPVADSGTRLVITEPALVEKLAQARAADPDLTVVSADPDDGDLQVLDALRRPGAKPPRAEIAADDGAFLCYTSGTTGFAKGALLTHGGVRTGGIGRVVPDGITWRDTQLLPGALAFTGGIVSCFCQITLISGATLVLEREFDPTRCLELIARERITVLNLVPPILQFLADLPEFETADLSTVWSVSSGGSPLSAPLIRRWQERGVRISQAYGLTEASGGVSLLGPDQALEKTGSAGRPMPHIEVRVVDDDNDVPVGEIGEIIVRGPTLMKEYWRQPEATAHALRGGWLHTGDLGTLDAEGYLTMVDRKKDMIISGAINVYPAEIERALVGVPGLGEFAVIGVPDPKWGEVPVIVVGSADLPDLEALSTRCKSELADYKRPRYLVAHGGPLPRNMAAKLLKRELRDSYAEIPASAHRLG